MITTTNIMMASFISTTYINIITITSVLMAASGVNPSAKAEGSPWYKTAGAVWPNAHNPWPHKRPRHHKQEVRQHQHQHQHQHKESWSGQASPPFFSSWRMWTKFGLHLGCNLGRGRLPLTKVIWAKWRDNRAFKLCHRLCLGIKVDR